jgi:octaprenyl-diphosphate synthase
MRNQTASKLEPIAASLQPLQDMLSTDLQAVNKEIITRLQSKVDLIPQLASHLIAAGGKRLRPLLTLAAAQLCGYTGDRHIKLAACVEFIHTATLLHDDVVDHSDKRRGLDTANAIWGNKASVLVGDFLFSRSFQLMVEDGSLEVLRILSGASATIAEGEVAQLLTANNMATTEEEYLAVIRAKTAALFSAAAEIGAVIADRPQTEQQALHEYGLNLGLAFQISDDVLDYAPNSLGKNMGDDFRDGKVTLPIILAYQKAAQPSASFGKNASSSNRLRTRI